MNAIILAAGVGRRLGQGDDHPPKCLLRFGGKTLLARHLEILQSCGIRQVAIGVGYQAGQVRAEITGLGLDDFAATVFNPDYELGSILTLWTLRGYLNASSGDLSTGGGTLLMDADVLYDHRLLRRLVDSEHPNCCLMDLSFEAGDEPVKLCVRDATLVEFRKKVDVAYDFCGESVGFFKLSQTVARDLAGVTRRFVDAGKTGECYEEALREMILSPDCFGFEDITGLPWTEIDFPQDVQLAQEEILPRLTDG